MRILYLVRRPAGDDRRKFRDEVLDYTRQKLLSLADTAVLAVTEEPPPRVSVIPFRQDLIALISLDGVDELSLWPDPIRGFTGAYVGDVAYPVIHEQTWDTGQQSPGAGLLTLFRKKKGLEDEEFLRRWYEGHTPLTLEVHPNVGYVRNRVTGIWPAAGSAAGPACVQWDGIVEEQYDPPENLLRPWNFFGGNLLRMPFTMLRVYRDIKGFIDYGSIETWLTREYRLKGRTAG